MCDDQKVKKKKKTESSGVGKIKKSRQCLAVEGERPENWLRSNVAKRYSGKRHLRPKHVANMQGYYVTHVQL